MLLKKTWIFALFGFALVAFADSTTDWQAAGQQASTSGHPILLYVSSPDCGYCQRLKPRALEPWLHAQAASAPLLVEVDLHQEGKWVDFDGDKVRARVFLHRYSVFATPTLLFLDPQGHPLTPAMVGYDDDAAQAKVRLSEALISATRQMKRSEPEDNTAVIVSRHRTE